jgi:hypothetical protein
MRVGPQLLVKGNKNVVRMHRSPWFHFEPVPFLSYAVWSGQVGTRFRLPIRSWKYMSLGNGELCFAPDWNLLRRTGCSLVRDLARILAPPLFKWFASLVSGLG